MQWFREWEAFVKGKDNGESGGPGPGRPLPVLAGTRGPPTSWECPRRRGLGCPDLSPPSTFLAPAFPALTLCMEHGSSPRPMLGSGPHPGRAFWLQQDRSCLMLPVLFLPLCPMVTGMTALPPARAFPLGTPWP